MIQFNKSNSATLAVMCLMFVIACLPLTSCKDKDKEEDEGNVLKAGELYLMDISEETDWNYMMAASDGSSVFIDVDEVSGLSRQLFCKLDKKSDEGYAIFFQENGLPDKLVVDEYIICYGNFRGNKYDMALISPDKSIEYFSDIESDVNWDEYLETPKMTRSMLKSGGFLSDDARKYLKYVVHGLSGMSCGGGTANLPSGTLSGATVTLLGCGSGLLSAAKDDQMPLPVYLEKTDDVMIGALTTAMGCTVGDKFSCITGTASLMSTAILRLDDQVADYKLETERAKERFVGANSVSISVTANTTINVSYDGICGTPAGIGVCYSATNKLPTFTDYCMAGLDLHAFEYTTTVDQLLKLSPDKEYHVRGFVETAIGTLLYSKQAERFTVPAEGGSSFTGNTITAVVENGEKYSNIKQVRAYFYWYYDDSEQGDIWGTDELGSASYANGRFTLTLPDNVATECRWATDDIAEGVSSSNGNVSISHFLEWIEGYSTAVPGNFNDDNYIGDFIYYKKEANADIFGCFVWATGAVKITGSYEDEKWSLNLNAGWNLAYLIETASGYEITSKAVSGLKWYYYDEIFGSSAEGKVKTRKNKRIQSVRSDQ